MLTFSLALNFKVQYVKLLCFRPTPRPPPPQEEAEPHHCDHGRVLEMYQQEKKKKDDTQWASNADLVRRMHKLTVES